MIRYPGVSAAKITADVAAYDATWLARAATETQRLIQVGAFRRPPVPPGQANGRRPAPPPSLWSDIKVVYMRLQHNKCIFCERALAGEDGKIEQDVEHYRPKNAVKAWRAPRGHAAIPHQTGGAADTGYYWLAYDLENYAAACKPCNSTRKGTYFPIAGRRGAATDTVHALDNGERPYLVFPMRDDPARFITFRGALAIPKGGNAHDVLRASVTIALFELNTTPELIDERFRLIRLLDGALKQAIDGRRSIDRERALSTIADLTGAHAPHSACGKAFLDLVETNQILADQIIEEAWAALPAGVSRR